MSRNNGESYGVCLSCGGSGTKPDPVLEVLEKLKHEIAIRATENSFDCAKYSIGSEEAGMFGTAMAEDDWIMEKIDEFIEQRRKKIGG